MFFGSGFYRVGKIEIGELSNFYSFNDVEGTRLRLSVRTNNRYFKKMRLEGHTAYGFKDGEWKFGAPPLLLSKVRSRAASRPTK